MPQRGGINAEGTALRSQTSGQPSVTNEAPAPDEQITNPQAQFPPSQTEVEAPPQSQDDISAGSPGKKAVSTSDQAATEREKINRVLSFVGNLQQQRDEQQAQKQKERDEKEKAEREQNKKDAEEATTITTTKEDGTQVTERSVAAQQAMQSQLDSIDDDAERANNLLDEMSATVDAQTKSMIRQIQSRYDRRRKEQKQQNKRILRGVRTMGIRSGRARFAPEIQQSIISAEERAGHARLTELDQEEAQLILEAQQANQAKQFKLMQEKIDQIDQKRKEKINIISNLHTMSMQEEQLAIKKAKFQQDISQDIEEQAEDTLNRMAEAGEQPTESDFQELSGALNISTETAKSLYETKRRVAQAQTQSEIIGAQQDILNIMQDIPQGKTVTFPDGTQYTGMGDTGDFYTSMQVDDQGNARLIKFNKATNETQVINVGRIGRSGSVGGAGGTQIPEQTRTQKQDIVATGADIFSPFVQNQLVSLLDEQQMFQFVNDFKQAAKKGGQLEGVDVNDDEMVSEYLLNTWIPNNLNTDKFLDRMIVEATKDSISSGGQ